MKAKVKTQEFASILHRACTIASKRHATIMPVLSHVLVRTKDSALEITGTDLECTYIGLCPAEVEEAGEVALPATPLFQIVKSVEAEEIPLYQRNNKFQIATKKSHFSLVTMDPDDFPTIKVPEGLKTVTVPLDELTDAMAMVMPCTGADDTDYIVRSILCERRDEGLRFVATDRTKLACAVVRVRVPDEFPGRSLFSKDVCRVVSVLRTQEVSIGFNREMGVVEAGSEKVLFRLISEPYPEIEEIINATKPYRVEIDAKRLVDALNRLAIMRPRAIKLTFEKEKLSLFCSESSTGEAYEEIFIKNGPDQPQGFKVAANIIQRLLSPLYCNSVFLSFSCPEEPCIITTADVPDYLSVFMPVIET